MFEHQHPLSLIDLQLPDLEYEEEHGDGDSDSDSEEDSPTNLQDFRCQCHRCAQEINWFHRYYYKCSSDSCGYSIHKFCADLPATLEHPYHLAHPLILLQRDIRWWCNVCRSRHEPQDLSYYCSLCDFDIDVSCAMKWLKNNIIHHPSHMHPLVAFIKPIMCDCDACGKEHEGIFYQCTACLNPLINTNCAFLPKKLFIQHTTNDFFYHTHPLALAYSFSMADQAAKFNPRCRVCGGSFIKNANLWIYKCDKCRYYAHLDCATSREEPFMSILSAAGLGKTLKNFIDADYPDLLHLPFPDQTCSILKHMFFNKTTTSQTFEGNLRHMSHQHPLILVDVTKPTASSKVKQISCHDPMKKIELLCNGCLRPITDVPFYKCEQQSCNFVLHEWCTRLPTQVQTHPGHDPQHSLVLLPNSPHKFFCVFKCAICRLPCNGFVYSCVQCEYHVDVSCAFIPEKIVHDAHPNHLMWIRVESSKTYEKDCSSCLYGIQENGFSFSCHTCDFVLHPECALLLPQTIKHKYDNHPLKLSYFPIENHKSEYFCEICEEKFDPERWFYHCNVCSQSIHSACAPFILESESAPHDLYYPKRIHKFVNIKFGGLHNIEDHSHPLSFVQGIKSDGTCTKCSYSLEYKMIFKCLQCNFTIHFKCCKGFNNW